MIPKIADAELEIMRILWREGRPLSFKELRAELESKWNSSTIQTLLGRLRNKGAISTQTHYVTLYSFNVTEQEYVRAEEKTFLDKLFSGNAKKLVASLCQSGQLEESDIDELKQFFTMGESQK